LAPGFCCWFPVGFGVNWVCTMDVAIRAVNWLAGYALFDCLSEGKYAKFHDKLTRSLWEHARFIETHLEWSGPFSRQQANHFLSDITGLFTLGVFFRDTLRGKRWLQSSKKKLEAEIRHQVLEDGVHFECSIAYHRLCLEMFLWCHSLGERCGVDYSETYKRKIMAMQEFASVYTRPDDLVSLVGDNDDGRLLYSGLAGINNHRYLWSSDLSAFGRLDAALLFGNKTQPVDLRGKSGFFTASGFYFFRDLDIHLLIRAGRLAVRGGHAHNDQLSFELCIGREPVFVDRGSFVYTSDPDKRNLYRGTRAHNVLSINGVEQNPVDKGLFCMPDDTCSRVLELHARLLKVCHKGFPALGRTDLRQVRTFAILKEEKKLEICDELEGLKQDDLIEWFFHLAPGLQSEVFQNTVVILKGSDFVCRVEFPEGVSVYKEPFAHSPSYGCLKPAEVLIFRKRVVEDVRWLAMDCQIVWER